MNDILRYQFHTNDYKEKIQSILDRIGVNFNDCSIMSHQIFTEILYSKNDPAINGMSKDELLSNPSILSKKPYIIYDWQQEPFVSGFSKLLPEILSNELNQILEITIPEHIIFIMGTQHEYDLIMEMINNQIIPSVTVLLEKYYFGWTSYINMKDYCPHYDHEVVHKKFDCINHHDKPFRLMSYLLLKKYDLLKGNNVSYVGHQFVSNLQKEVNMTDVVKKIYPELNELVDEYYAPSDFPRYLDNISEPYIDRFSYQNHKNCYTTALDIQLQSDFSLVNETLGPWNDSLFYTEKTFRNLSFGIPFFLHMTSGALKELKDDFQLLSYDGYIDESYDSIENYSDKILNIVNQIHTIMNYSDSSYREWAIGTKKIAKQNKERFMNYYATI